MLVPALGSILTMSTHCSPITVTIATWFTVITLGLASLVLKTAWLTRVAGSTSFNTRGSLTITI